ncbi:MAG TPA: UvrD-helicase domain-containing protein [Coriobacteriia bacterium]|jgi:ATP-dependent exoDNAse (exonuclease V) beta subunit
MSEASAGTEGLNEEQARAARHLAGPLLIDAGAGSGKTRTLTQRVVCALTPGSVPGWQAVSVEEILAITFTEKAAGEIGERVRRALRAAGRFEDARRLDAAWFSTIHGACSRLLRRHALEAGVDPAFRVIDGVEAHGTRERAFAESAREAMAASDAGEALFGAYGFETVAVAVKALHRELRTRGLGPDVLLVEPAPDAGRVLQDAVAFFRRMGADWEACPSATATAQSQREGCRTTVSSLERIGGSSMPPHLLAAEVWDAIDAHPKPPSKLKGAEGIIAEMLPERTSLLQKAACAATAPMAEALRSLVERYGSRYRAAKQASGGLDFDDLQLEALRLLERRPDIARRQREQFRLVMVDEFQDTDRLQLELVRALAGTNLCTVGDERQSIYRFRGADLEVYREHVLAMKEAGALSVALAENYRSHPDILAFVNAAFGSSALFGDTFLELRAMRDGFRCPRPPVGERVQVVLIRRKGNAGVVAQEAAVIAERFAALRDGGVATGSMAVLLRTYKHAEEYAAALRARGMQPLILGGSRFFDRPEVRTLRALCRALANADDDEALALLLASPVGGLSDDALWLLRNDPSTGRRSSPLSRPLLAGEVEFPCEDASAAALFEEVWGRARSRVGRMPLSEILLRVVEESAWDLRLLAGGDAGTHAYANVLKFARLTDEFESAGGTGPAGFVEYLDAKEESGDPEAPATLADETSRCVRIMSVHASKGLEFAVVALPQLGDGPRAERGPVRWKPEGGRISLALALPPDRCHAEGSKTNGTAWFALFDASAVAAEEEEAKRLLYVACTRAEEVLLLTGATNLEEVPAKRSPLEWLSRARAEILAGGGELPAEWECVDAEGQETAGPVELEADAEEAGAFRPAPPAGPAPSPAKTPDRLSYSDIALYRSCGLRFYAEKVLRLGAASRPDPAGDPRAFGSAVHAALQLAVAGTSADAARLAAIARAFGLGGDDAVHLGEVVRGFLGSALAAEVAACVSVGTEVSFVVPVGPQTFLLHGTMDAYAKDGGRGLVVDYKTGTDGTPQVLRERFALQAACYGLVALRDGCGQARVVFARLESSKGDGPQTIEYSFASGDAHAIEAELLAEHERMGAGEYEPSRSHDRRSCAGCPASAVICPLQPYGSQR